MATHMSAVTMPYYVGKAGDLRNITAGNQFQAGMVVKGNDAHLENIKAINHGRRTVFTGAVFLSMICLSCCSGGSGSSNGPLEAQRRGERLYNFWCAPCHEASDLHLVKDPPKLRGIFFRPTLPSGAPATDEQVRKTISEGRGIMPPFQQSLKAGEVDDLIQFLHTLKNE